MLRQFELVEKVRAYDPDVDEDAINRAYVYAMQMHGSQKRASGDPYFSHPIEVAGLLTRYRIDSASIVTALLHDTLEDTKASYDELVSLFGHEVASLVDGVTKLNRIELQSTHTKQAENFRKLLMAMSKDIRVLLVKLADRVHNMRTLHHLEDPDKRRRIATETMEIYAPLAERIGMEEFKNELEDLAFNELFPEARDSIHARMAFLRDQGGGLIPRILASLQEDLAAEGVEAHVSGREKAPYSIWSKMQRKNVTFEQLSDVMAFRVVVDDMTDCYRALGVIHARYRTVPGRFKDYISTPKRNGYRSLHTGVIGPENHRIEIQIRTHEMHEVAEVGFAAHWQYKAGERRTDGTQYRWVRELLEILEHASDPEEFLEHTKLEMHRDQVFCFTPKGDLIALPQGATPIDFAYAVHSEVGNHCVGAKVNGRMVPLRTALSNGDQVDVVTSRAQEPSPEWERFVVTGKARAGIRRHIRERQRDEYIKLGREMLSRAFRQADHVWNERATAQALRVLGMAQEDDLCAQVGAGVRSVRDVLMAVHPALKDKAKGNRAEDAAPKPAKRSNGHGAPGAGGMPIEGLIPGMAVHMAGCCHPLPGDRIVGIVHTGSGVTVHTIDCTSLAQFGDQPERWLDLGWGSDAHGTPHVGRVRVVMNNRPGSLGAVTTTVARTGGNISNLKVTQRSPVFFEMLLDIEVTDVRHLSNVIAALRAQSDVSDVDRARS